jgi:hypothetical protein
MASISSITVKEIGLTSKLTGALRLATGAAAQEANGQASGAAIC